MGIFGIFGKSNKSNYYDHLLNLYNYLSNTYRLHYHQESGVFQVLTRRGTLPWPGIKVHSPLSDKIYNVLIDQHFQQMMINREIDGIKIYESHSHKQVTFYISFHSIPGYKKLLHIFRAHGINVEPKLRVHRDTSGSYVSLNRMYIAKDIYVRYSTDFYNIKKDHPKIDDSKWRSAADNGHPNIWAVSRSYLLNRLYNLNYEDNSHIITFLTLINHSGIRVPVPNIILSLSSIYNRSSGYNIVTLITYDVYEGKIIKYDLSTEKNIMMFSRIVSDHPEQRLLALLG
ncbi:MAG: hypothetical protein RQ869_01450 [Candidatus Nanopusillus sp.]|nr:hypothetical protein [Candidatus Nanopusillus sp.]